MAGDLLEERDQDLGRADLLLIDEDVGVFEHDLHAVLVGDEVRAEVAPVELHALDDVDGRLEALALLDGDDAVLADPLEGVGELLADGRVVVGGDRGDLGDLLVGDLLGLALDVLDDGEDGLVDPSLQGHRVGAGGQGLQALLEDGLGQDGGGGGAVAGDVGGLRGGLLDELGAHVLVGVGQLDLLGHGHAVLGDGRAAPALIDHGVAPARPQGAPDGPGQLGDAARQLLAGLLIVGQHLRHGEFSLVAVEIRRGLRTPSAKADAGTPRTCPRLPESSSTGCKSRASTFRPMSVSHSRVTLTCNTEAGFLSGRTPVCRFGRFERSRLSMPPVGPTGRTRDGSARGGGSPEGLHLTRGGGCVEDPGMS